MKVRGTCPGGRRARGSVDHRAGSGIRVFGPGRQAARLESSKIWAKQFMMGHGVPTAPFSVHRVPDEASWRIREMGGRAVVKYDGLAAGKGGFVTSDGAAAAAPLAQRGAP